MKQLEIRSINTEFTADSESRTIHGLAIPVNSRSALLGGEFYETISPDAITTDFLQTQDIKLYLDHDASHGTYARSKFGQGTLNLTITERGLEFDTEVPNTVFGDALLEGIRRGDYDAISFAFIPDDDQWSKNEDNTLNRMINSFRMLDEISILSQLPAYEATSIDIRSLNDFKHEEEERKQHEAELIAKLDGIVAELDENCKKIFVKY